MNIGVARPSIKELAEVKHHFIAHKSILEDYNAGAFEQDAIKKLDELFTIYDKLILTGGSGLYIDAVSKGMDNLPDTNKHARYELNQIYKKQGIEPLRKELKEKDEEYYSIVDIHNHIRLIRALEIIHQTGNTYTSYRKNQRKNRGFRIRKYALMRNREALVNRIDLRVDIMIEQGLVQEAEKLYPYKDLTALKTVGYKEIFKYFEKEISLQQAIEEIKINTRKYAKRQMTWFRKDKDYIWLNANEEINWKEIIDEIS